MVRRDLQFRGLTGARFVIVSRRGWTLIVLARAPPRVMRFQRGGGERERFQGSRALRRAARNPENLDVDGDEVVEWTRCLPSNLHVPLRPSFVAILVYTYRSVLSRYEIAPAAERGAELLNHYSPAHITAAQ